MTNRIIEFKDLENKTIEKTVHIGNMLMLNMTDGSRAIFTSFLYQLELDSLLSDQTRYNFGLMSKEEIEERIAQQRLNDKYGKPDWTPSPQPDTDNSESQDTP